MLFLRPVENSLGSPDNAMLGLNLRWKVSRSTSVYGQLLLDEFLLDEVRSGRGWWGNKQAVQLGFKSFGLAGIKALNIHGEFNYVRPFTYQHRTSAQNYVQYNQPLAHPLGAGFYEAVGFINYRWRNFFTELKLQYARCGRDTAGENLGNDIFLSYDSRSAEYGYFFPTGNPADLRGFGWRVNYLVNARTNFTVEAGIELRDFSGKNIRQQSSLLYFGLRTALENYYFDF
jgi:hypothetical protein